MCTDRNDRPLFVVDSLQKSTVINFDILTFTSGILSETIGLMIITALEKCIFCYIKSFLSHMHGSRPKFKYKLHVFTEIPVLINCLVPTRKIVNLLY